MITKLLDRLDGVKRVGDGWLALCPAHDDHNPSLSINEGEDGRIQLYCHAGCDIQDICSSLNTTERDLFPKKGNIVKKGTKLCGKYNYRDENRKLLYQACRATGKKFWLRRPNGKGGSINNMKGVRWVIYRLPEVVTAELELGLGV